MYIYIYIYIYIIYLNESNIKHASRKKELLDTEIYIKNKLHTKIFREKTDRQTFLNINSEHPKSLKNSIKPNSTNKKIEYARTRKLKGTEGKIFEAG